MVFRVFLSNFPFFSTVFFLFFFFLMAPSQASEERHLHNLLYLILSMPHVGSRKTHFLIKQNSASKSEHHQKVCCVFSIQFLFCRTRHYLNFKKKKSWNWIEISIFGSTINCLDGTYSIFKDSYSIQGFNILMLFFFHLCVLLVFFNTKNVV